MTPGGSSSGCSTRSILSSAFSSSFAFSSLARSMMARVRSFIFLSSTRKVLRSIDVIFRSRSIGALSLVPAGIASSTVPDLSASDTVWPSSRSISSASRTSLTRIFSSPSSLRMSPILSPRSFSTTWSSMREKIFTSITTPSIPGGTLSDESFTSFAFSPKIAVNSFSSGESSVSPFGVILPTRMSPGLTCAPMRTIPRSSRSLKASSATFGISRVISS